uniref:hypothetical protein n=1 Tax=uncultured Tenacibaculum sp. TaxID=174713 RepID=UPI0026273979|nr:hypothetical protein [uncultured Tenacibaculum sp.]
MKKVYNLEVDNQKYWEWRIVLSEKEDKRFNVIENLDNNKQILVPETEKIRLFLINLEEKSLRKEKSFQSDIIYWTDDITLGAFSPSNGIIISKRLKKILTSYSLPHHYIYPVEIINAETLETNYDYYLLQVLGNINEITNFKESIYIYIKRNEKRKKEVIKTVKGAFVNYDDYHLQKRKMFYDEPDRKKRINININRILETSYDVLPSFLNILRVTEDFLIENNNLEGIKFEEVKDMTVLNEDNYLQ